MNKAQADALCAIIALGFIGQNQREPETGRTLYIYDNNADAAQHNRLRELLGRKFGIDITSNLQNARDTTGRKILPFIYALPYKTGERLDFFTAVTAEADNILSIAQQAEDQVNLIAGPNDFRGAYIGGFIDFERKELSLIGPSSLYVRDFEHIDPAALDFDPTMAAIYTNFNDVTTRLKDFLTNQAPALYSGVNFDDAYCEIIIAPDLTEELISEGTPDDIRLLEAKRKVIASCHGLVTSMYYHSDVSADHLNKGVCIEFSLSNGTCKSASCIPCAIFAAAQGTPASQVHFGRGDFWNLPKPAVRNALNAELEKNWRAFVTACYISASQEILELEEETESATLFRSPATLEMAHLAATIDPQDMERVIPDMFLDALTVPGSFIRKLLDSFGEYEE